MKKKDDFGGKNRGFGEMGVFNFAVIMKEERENQYKKCGILLFWVGLFCLVWWDVCCFSQVCNCCCVLYNHPIYRGFFVEFFF